MRLECQVRREEPQVAWQLGRLQHVATLMGKKEPRTASENFLFQITRGERPPYLERRAIPKGETSLVQVNMQNSWPSGNVQDGGREIYLWQQQKLLSFLSPRHC